VTSARRQRRPDLTPEEIERIGDLRARNHTIEAIAEVIGCSVGTVRWACLRECFEPSKPRPLPPLYKRPKVVVRNGHPVRRFTEREDRLLLALEAQGLRISAIAKRLGRKPNSVLGRLYTLARRDARAEVASASVQPKRRASA